MGVIVFTNGFSIGCNIGCMESPDAYVMLFFEWKLIFIVDIEKFCNVPIIIVILDSSIKLH